MGAGLSTCCCVSPQLLCLAAVSSQLTQTPAWSFTGLLGFRWDAVEIAWLWGKVFHRRSAKAAKMGS